MSFGLIPPLSHKLKMSALKISIRAEKVWVVAEEGTGVSLDEEANLLKQTSTPETKEELKTWACIGLSHGSHK